MIKIHPEMQVIADSKCQSCDGVHESLGVCPIAILMRMKAGKWLARGNMFKFEAAKKEYMQHVSGERSFL